MSSEVKNRLICATRQFRHNSDNSPDMLNPAEGFVCAYDRKEVDDLITQLQSDLTAAKAEIERLRGRVIFIDPVNGKPQVTSAMKAEHIGEFEFAIIAECGECIDIGADDDCEICQGGIEYERKVTVPWNTCKKIYKAMAESAVRQQAEATENGGDEAKVLACTNPDCGRFYCHNSKRHTCKARSDDACAVDHMTEKGGDNEPT